LTSAPPTVPFAKPELGADEVDAVRRVVESGWVTQGPEVGRFEAEFADFVGASHACAAANCTAALHMALLAVGVGPGDEVVTVTHSHVASASCVRYCGATPVLVDIDPTTYNVDPGLIERALSERTRAIIAVHQLGMPCDLAAILPLAEKRGIPVVEDAACSTGSAVDLGDGWERIGRPHGAIACFSFHPRKLLTTGDGGMLTTNRAELDRKIRLLRQHGMSVSDAARHGSDRVIMESYDLVGFNYRMTDLQAAIGRVQLERLPEQVANRRRLAERYATLLGGIPGLRVTREPSWARSNWQTYVVGLPESAEPRAVMQYLLDRGVHSRKGVLSIHREPAYRDGGWSCGAGPGPCGCPASSCRRLLHSEHAQDHTILLPQFPGMSDTEQDHVVDSLRAALSAA
jgi:perosamine synthetase